MRFTIGRMRQSSTRGLLFKNGLQTDDHVTRRKINLLNLDGRRIAAAGVDAARRAAAKRNMISRILPTPHPPLRKWTDPSSEN